MATGPELTRSGRDILEAAGWLTFTMNWPKAAPRGMVGFPDIIAFRDNHTLLIEVKGKGDILREKDIRFGMSIDSHIGNHLHYHVCKTVEDFQDAMDFGKWRQNDYD